MSVNITKNKNTELATVNQLPQKLGYTDWLTPSMVRHHIFASGKRIGADGEPLPTNGLKETGAIVRLGRKILIDVEKYRTWVLSHTAVTENQPDSHSL